MTEPTQRRTIDELEADNMKLRQLLAYRVAGHLLYADDGELQDASAFPFIDFKRDDVDYIEATLKQRGLLQLRIAGSQPTPSAHL